MFANQIRRAIEATPRVKLPEIRSALYKALVAGQVTDAEADALDDLITAKAALPAPERPPQRRVGSRPRSPASMERRRAWAAAGRLPPRLAARFTLAEQAVLAVIAAEVQKRGACTLYVGHIAALAGICASTVRNAMREAQALGLLQVEERRLTAWRNDSNRVTITSGEWLSWLRLRPKGGGYKSVQSPNTKIQKSGIPPRAFVPNANLVTALEQLRRAAGIAGDGSGEGGAR
jgi:hypothetical protein